MLRGGKLYPQVYASRLAINKIPMATPMCLWSNFSMVLSVTLPDRTASHTSKMAAEIMYRKYIHDGNKIAMAIPYFEGQESRRNKFE